MPNTLRVRLAHDHSADAGSHAAAVYASSGLMHRHNALGAKTPSPMTDKPLERPLNVVVGRFLTKALVGQIGSSLKERICNLLVHGRMVQRGLAFFNSHFPSPDSFVYDCTVVVGSNN